MARNDRREDTGRASRKSTGSTALIELWASLLVIVLVIYTVNINLDPSLNVSRRGFWESDEGAYAYNATALIRYNEFVTPGVLNCSTHCPALTFVQYLFFRCFGISLASSHMQGVCSAVAAQLLFMLFFLRKRIPGSGAAILMVTLLNIQMFFFSRSSVAETHTGVLMALATVLLFNRRLSAGKTWLRSIMLGILSVTAMLMKVYLLLTFAGAIVRYLLAEPFLDLRPARDRLRHVLLTISPFAAVLIAGIALYYVCIHRPVSV